MQINNLVKLREFPCPKCGLTGQTTSRNQKYCKHCAPLVKAQQTRNYQNSQRRV